MMDSIVDVMICYCKDSILHVVFCTRVHVQRIIKVICTVQSLKSKRWGVSAEVSILGLSRPRGGFGWDVQGFRMAELKRKIIFRGRS